MSLLYQLDETIERLLRLETFQTDNFSEREFIEKLGADLGSTLDPKPYIRQFEQALKELQRLQDETRVAQVSLVKKSKELDLAHAESLYDLGDAVESTVSDFNRMEERITLVTGATFGLSEKLKALSSQYDRTSEAAFLVKCYLSFVNTGQCPELSQLWESSSSGGVGAGGQSAPDLGARAGGGAEISMFIDSAQDRRLCARVVAQLQSLSSKIGDNHSSHEQIDKFAEQLEQDLLNKFDHAYNGFDLKAMREASDMLCDFNGGTSVVQMFVSQHEFFLVTDKLVDSPLMNEPEMWVRMSSPEGDTFEFEEAIQHYMNEIFNVTVGQMDVIFKVFRDPVIVVRVFIQRIFAQRIQQRLEDLFQFAEQQSGLAYVRALHICFNRVGGLVKQFKDLFSDSATAENFDPNGDIGVLLDQSFGDIFLSYIDNDRYFEAEKRNLQNVISITFSRFTEGYAQKRLARDQGILSRFASSLEKSTSTTPAGDLSPSQSLQTSNNKTNNTTTQNHENERSASTDESTKGRLGQIMRAVRREKTSSPSGDKNEDKDSFDEEDLELRYELVQRVLSAFAEAVSRDLELSSSAISRQHAMELLRLLVDSVGTRYIEVALDDALAASSEDQAKGNTIYLGYLRIVGTSSGCIKLVSLFSQTALFSMVQGSDRVHTHMATLLNSYMKNVESKASTVLQHTVELIRDKITQYLNKQKKKDFLPKDDRTSTAAHSSNSNDDGTSDANRGFMPCRESATPVCKDICILLDGFYSIAQDSIDGANLEQFLLSVGLNLRALLANHLKRFNISRAGGRVLAHDLQLYQETIDNWSLQQLSESFTILHEIGSLFTADPQAIPSLIRDSHLNQLKSVQIKDYVSKRVDYYSNSINNLVRPDHAGHLKPYLGSYGLYAR